MEYGYFDDLHSEYVITRPDTPYPWINYLGSEDFFSIMSNTSGGYSFYKDARLLRLTRFRYNNVPTDAGGHYFYIREGNDVWNPGWQPVKTKLDAYECRVGTGYTVIRGEKNGLIAEQTTMVPRGFTAEVTRLTLKNDTSKAKDVSLFSFIEFCLWNAQDDMLNFQRNFSTGEVEVEDGVGVGIAAIALDQRVQPFPHGRLPSARTKRGHRIAGPQRQRATGHPHQAQPISRRHHQTPFSDFSMYGCENSSSPEPSSAYALISA